LVRELSNFVYHPFLKWQVFAQAIHLDLQVWFQATLRECQSHA